MSQISLRDKKGITLIEVIVSMALIGLVGLMVFSFMNYGSVAFSQGKQQNNAQAELRLVHDYIASNMRFATNVALLSAVPGTFEAGFDYIYFDAGRMVHSIDDGGSRTTRAFGNNLLGSSFFSSEKQDSTQLIGLSLATTDHNRNFDLTTSIELANIALNKRFIVPDVTTAQVIKFNSDFVITYEPGIDPDNYYLVTTEPEPSTFGSSTQAIMVVKGGSVDVLATPEYGYKFVDWKKNGGSVSNAPSYSFTPTEDTHLVAHFAVDDTVVVVYVKVEVEIDVGNSSERDYVVYFAGRTQSRTVKDRGKQLFVFENVIGNASYGLLITKTPKNGSTANFYSQTLTLDTTNVKVELTD